jgi:hypothetical protein
MGKLNIDIVAEPYINKSGFCTDLIFEDGGSKVTMVFNL